jgi:hypothetical protein
MFSLGYRKLAVSSVVVLSTLMATACGPRVIISTGTTIGLKATPGDGTTRPPQVTLAYKRAETAFVPTNASVATASEDAFSTLAALHFSTKWFGETKLRSVVGTGIAARDLTGSAAFADQFAAATLGQVSEATQQRRELLIPKWQQLTEDNASRALDIAGFAKIAKKTAKQSLHDYILDAQTESQVAKLESVFFRIQGGK